MPSGATSATAGHPATIHLGVALAGDQAVTVRWQALVTPGGLTVSPSSRSLTLAPGRGSATGCRPPQPVSQPLSVTAPATGTYWLRVNLSTTSGLALPPVVVDVDVHR